MDLNNVVAISCRTNTGEMFEVPVREFFGLQSSQSSLGIGVVPKSDGKAFIASDVTEGVNGQLTFKNYKSETSFTGIPVGILAFDANGRIVTVPFQQSQSPPKTTTQESQTSSMQSTANKLPIWADNNGALGDSDIIRDGESYSVGGTMPFWKWDVYQGSVNIAQSSINDGFRLNGKLVVSYDPDSEEITIGNAVYTTTNIQHINTHSVSFNTSPSGTTMAPGVLRWNDTDGTLEFGMKGGNVTQQIGQELPILVKHANNAGLTEGTVVYSVGSDGSNKTVLLAKADAESTSSKTFGVMTESTTGGNKGFCTTFGLVRNIDTSGLIEGSAVYLSPTVAGGMTTTKPSAPNHMVQVGFCVRSHATVGSIFVSIHNGYEINEIHDIAIGTLANNNLLAYESSTSLWKNKTYTELGLATVTGSWQLGGNALTEAKSIGSISGDFDIPVIRNNATIATIKSTGLQLDVLAAESTDVDKFLVSNSGLVKYRTGTQLLSDIGAFATPSGLTTGTVPRWNGSAFINSSITDSGTIVTVPNILVSGLTASQLVATDASKNLVSLSTATYPSLTEISYIKGLTSSVQTQIDGKQPLDEDLTAIAAITATSGLLKKTAANTWSLDTNVYITGNETITLSGVVTGSGTTAITTAIADAALSIAKTSGLQAALDLKANLDGPTFTGTVILPSTTSIGTVNSTEIGYLDGVTSAIQTQLDSKFPTPSGLTTNYVTKWNGTALANSQLFDNGTNIGVGTTTLFSNSKLTLSGASGAAIFGVERTNPIATGGLGAIGFKTADASTPWVSAITSTSGSTTGTAHISFLTGTASASPFSLTERMRITDTGSVGIGTTSLTGYNLRVTKNLEGAATVFGISQVASNIQPVVTGSAIIYYSGVGSAAGVTMSTLSHFNAGSASFNSSTIAAQNGFFADSSLTGATNNYGFRGSIAAATGRWNNYHDGTAQNHFRGNVGIGSGTTTPSHELVVAGTTQTTNLKITASATVGKYWVCTNADGTGEWTALGSSGYLGTWNPSTNTPTIANGTGTAGTFYIATATGTWNSITFAVNDQVWYNGSIWEKVTVGTTIPTATASVLGGIKVGSGLSIDSGTGVLSVSTLNQNTTGSAATLTTSRNIAISGDLSWNVDFNGSANVTAVGTLATVNSNVGTFAGITVNGKGLVTGATALTTLAGYGITDAQPLDATLTALADLVVSTGIMVQTTGDSQFVLRSITGTTDRISVSNGNGGAGNPTIDISSSYVGQTSITTLGTITTGTWNGGVIPILYGGTGSSTQNFVDLTTDQAVDGIKEFYAEIKVKSNQLHLTVDFLNRGGSVASYGVLSNKLGAGGLILDVKSTGGLYFRADTTRKGLFDTNGLILSSSLGNSDVPTERLDVRGNIRYNTLLKPNNVAGTDGQFLGTNGTQDSWTTLTTSHISNLSSYTGFDNYFTETEANGRFVDFDTDQSINGIKSFADHINIGGSFYGEGIYSISGTNRTFAKISSDIGFVLNAGTRGIHFAQEEVVYMSAKNTGLLIGTALNKNTFASEKLQVNGNIRYDTLLKPNNVAGMAGQFLGTDGTQDAWTTLTTSHISGLSAYVKGSLSATSPLVYDDETGNFSILRSGTISNGYLHQDDWNFFNEKQGRISNYTGYSDEINDLVLITNNSSFEWVALSTSHISNLSSYTGFDTRYFTETESDARFAPISHTLDSHSNVTITSNSSGEILKWNGSAWINNTLSEAGIQPTLPNGTAGQFLIRNASNNLEWSTLELEPVGLSNNKIAVGDSANYLSEYNNFEFLDSRFISIYRPSDNTKALYMGMDSASNNSFITASGGRLTLKADSGIYLHGFTGLGNKMVIVDGDGKLNYTDIPSGGGGTSSLTSSYIGYGSTINTLTGNSTFTYLDNRYIHFSNSSSDFNIGTSGAAGFVESVNGNLNLQARSTFGVVVDDGFFKVNDLAGTGTRMVVADSSGVLSTQTIPSGGGVPALNSTQIGFGSGSNLLTSSSSFVYDNGSLVLTNTTSANTNVIRINGSDGYDKNIFFSEVGGTNNGAYVGYRAGVGGSPDPTMLVMQTINSDSVMGGIAIHRQNGHVYIGLNPNSKAWNSDELNYNKLFVDGNMRVGGSEIIISGTSFKLSLSDAFTGAYTPSNGDKCTLTYDSSMAAFVLQKMNTYNDGTRTYLIL